MSPIASLRWSFPIAVALSLTAAPTQAHDARTGAASMPEPPTVETLRCADGAAFACGQGETLTVQGEGLAQARSVTFLGAPGRSDDRGATPQQRASHRLTVSVPDDATAGPVRVLARTSSRTQRSRPSRPLEVAPAGGSESAPESTTTPVAVAVGTDDAKYPIRGMHTYGESSVNRFGGGRGHQGQDVFAPCGTPLVAAQGGKVERAGFEGAMGNHVVVTRPDGGSHVYMHLAGPPKVRSDDPVAAGQPLGAVGQTGRATGCHLHFEIWTASGWTRGAPIDPLAALQAWETKQ